MEKPKNLNKFVLANSDEKNAKYHLFGVPEQGGSDGLAYFEGSSAGPKEIRKASQLYCSYHRKENGVLKTYISNSFGIIDNPPIFADIGDIKKRDVPSAVSDILQDGGFPIMLGGDHSITYDVLKGYERNFNKVAVVYFDAHPDFRSSEKDGRKSYGTGLYDASLLKYIDIKKSILIGVRDIEPEEFVNLKKSQVPFLTSLDVQEIGAKDVLSRIKKVTGNLPIYISIDLDVIDPSEAPDVSTPSPCGLSGRELLYFLTNLVGENVVGLDVVECCPSKDKRSMSATLASKLIIEFVIRHNVGQTWDK